ncbi:hypothetical protein BD410DRAFT_778303 [Rickenella mellea]|uniref:N-acetyl-D-glucosamine kinase n=1 Tax=Rickenella mellea TaxID=50990 RepID=A0A4Y7PKU1_9AGAM|nr:hypothetical protein BD410DRAFT_778303 [Rickenella mellea]
MANIAIASRAEAELYLCVDCGGSKTAVSISDASGTIISRALGGPSNFAYLGLANFTEAVKSTVEHALQIIPRRESNIIASTTIPSPKPFFAAAWLGISGVDSAANVAELTPVLSALLSIPAGPRLVIANDTHLLASPLRLYPDAEFAVTVIAGTGSIAVSFKREDDGGGLKELARMGGWGWILGDEGGGYDVGREALRHILREHDLSTLHDPPPPTPSPDSQHSLPTLTKRTLTHFSVSSPPELLTLIHDPDPPQAPSTSSQPSELEAPRTHRLLAREKRISQLCPLVFSAAFDGADPLALKVLACSAGKLADQITALLRTESKQGGGEGGGERSVPANESLVCFGGSLAGVARYREMVLEDLSRRRHVFKHVEFVAQAADAGAVALSKQFNPR